MTGRGRLKHGEMPKFAVAKLHVIKTSKAEKILP